MPHTPAPWDIRRAKLPVDGAFDHAVSANGEVIAEAFGRSSVSHYHDSEANARLIAAAPDYWDAAEQLSTDASELDGDDAGYVAVTKSAYDALMAAHQKAKGVA